MTVYPAIYCWNKFDHYIRHISLDDVQLYVALCGLKHFNLRGTAKMCRMGITPIFKILIWGGILSDIRSEIKFYRSASVSP